MKQGEYVETYEKLFFTSKPIEQLTEVQAEKKAKFYSLQESPHDIRFEMFQRASALP